MSGVTQWFEIVRDGHPMNHGIYEVRYSQDDLGGTFRRFNGAWVTRDGLYELSFGNHGEPFEYYRGLAENPNKKESE